MELRPFGRTDLRVSAIGVGCARLGGIFKPESGSFVELLAAALDGGINFFDTSDMYSQGESEALLGRAFCRRRSEVIIASKAGFKLPAQRRAIARIKPLVRPLIRMLGLKRENLPAAVRGELSQDFSPDYLRRCVEGSLSRLRTDRLDLFQLHSPPAEVVERGDWVEVLDTLRAEGKIRWYGVSCDDARAARAALQHPGVACVQIPVSMLEHAVADAVLPAAAERGVALIAREVLANGLLVKDPAGLDLARYCSSEAEQQRRARQLELARQLAAQQGTTVAQLALQFASRLPGVSVSLVGVRTRGQLDDLLRIAGAAPLAEAALRSAGGL